MYHCTFITIITSHFRVGMIFIIKDPLPPIHVVKSVQIERILIKFTLISSSFIPVLVFQLLRLIYPGLSTFLHLHFFPYCNLIFLVISSLRCPLPSFFTLELSGTAFDIYFTRTPSFRIQSSFTTRVQSTLYILLFTPPSHLFQLHRT